MPTILCGSPGAIALARSVTFIDGILGTKISPPFIISKEERTMLIPCSSVIQKRVMSGCVIGMKSAPSATSLRKKGNTLPRDPMTFP